jgi:hypothetical protein
MFYFSDAPVPPNAVDPDQLRGVNDFRQRITGQGALYATYNGPDDFETKVRQHLMKRVTLMARTEEDPQEHDDWSDRSDQPPRAADADDSAAEDLLDLRLRLESKLAWVCKHLLAGPNTPTYATIGSLYYDGYLTHDDARVAARLLGFSGEGYGQERRNLAIAGGPLVASFRAIVFDAYVRKALLGAGWVIVDLDEPSGPRPDFVISKGDRSLRVAPRVVTTRVSRIRDRTVDRLAASGDDPAVERRIVVIPDASRSPEDGRSADPRVVKLAALVGALSES